MVHFSFADVSKVDVLSLSYELSEIQRSFIRSMVIIKQSFSLGSNFFPDILLQLYIFQSNVPILCPDFRAKKSISRHGRWCSGTKYQIWVSFLLEGTAQDIGVKHIEKQF